MNQSELPEATAWVSKAREDLTAARVLVAHAPELDSVICFHCQQCMEKYLKAALVALDLGVPRNHDLDVLLSTLLPHHPSLERIRETASYLNGFSVLPRYPTFQTSVGDARERSHRALIATEEAVCVIAELMDFETK